MHLKSFSSYDGAPGEVIRPIQSGRALSDINRSRWD